MKRKPRRRNCIDRHWRSGRGPGAAWPAFARRLARHTPALPEDTRLQPLGAL